MTEMQQLLEDYDRDSRYVLKQMYKWLTPKEMSKTTIYKNMKRKAKNEKSRQDDKSSR